MSKEKTIILNPFQLDQNKWNDVPQLSENPSYNKNENNNYIVPLTGRSTIETMLINHEQRLMRTENNNGLCNLNNVVVYLSPTGDDIEGNGSAIAPFYSINKAVSYFNTLRFSTAAYCYIHMFPGVYYYNEEQKVFHPDFGLSTNNYIYIEQCPGLDPNENEKYDDVYLVFYSGLSDDTVFQTWTSALTIYCNTVIENINIMFDAKCDPYNLGIGIHVYNSHVFSREWVGIYNCGLAGILVNGSMASYETLSDTNNKTYISIDAEKHSFSVPDSDVTVHTREHKSEHGIYATMGALIAMKLGCIQISHCKHGIMIENGAQFNQSRSDKKYKIAYGYLISFYQVDICVVIERNSNALLFLYDYRVNGPDGPIISRDPNDVDDTDGSINANKLLTDPKSVVGSDESDSSLISGSLHYNDPIIQEGAVVSVDDSENNIYYSDTFGKESTSSLIINIEKCSYYISIETNSNSSVI